MLKCRFCKNKLLNIVLDLDNQPSANRLLSETEVLNINQGKSEYQNPLIVYLCKGCSLVQLGETEKPLAFETKLEIFVKYSAKISVL